MDQTVDVKINEIAKEVTSVSAQAGALVIKTEADVASATEFLSKIKLRIDRTEELRTFFVKPLNDQVKAINAKFKEQSAPLENAFALVKRAIGNFRMEQDRAIAKEEARLKALQDAKNVRREEKGKPLDLTPAPSIERPDTVVATEAGKTVANKVWTYRITDINAVPRQYLRCEVKHAILMDAIKSGARSIEGVEIFEDYDVRVSAK